MDSLPFVGWKASLTLSELKPKKAKLVEKKGKLLKRKKRREENEILAANSSLHLNKDKHAGQASGNGSLEVETQCEIADSSGIEEASIGKRVKTKKVKKGRKSKRNDLHVSEENSKMEDINITKMDAEKVDEIPSMDEDCSRGMKIGQASRNGSLEVKAQSETVDSSSIEEVHIGKRVKTKKVKKGRKSKRNDLYVSEEKIKMEDNISKMDAEKVDEISSVDEDCSRGMKKWLINYKESRPGLKMLQERIDDFITTYEAQQEQEMKEREALAAEGGWTVVVHHKGRKKTTDAESGITVGSVAQAAVLDNMARKKNKEVAVDFYRFQKREAQRSEVMMLQSKFEQDKKRIQQLRAARKFRPY